MEIIIITDWIQMTEFGKKEKLLFKEFHDLTRFVRGIEYEAPNGIGNVGWHYKGNYEKIRVKYILKYKTQKEKYEIMQLLSGKMKLSSSLIEVFIDTVNGNIAFAKELRDIC